MTPIDSLRGASGKPVVGAQDKGGSRAAEVAPISNDRAMMSHRLSTSVSNAPGDDPILEVENLNVTFATSDGMVRAVRGLSYDLTAGRTLALVGESGSGKSVSTQAILGLVRSPPGYVSGSVKYRGVELVGQRSRDLRKIRGKEIGLILQDALASLDPVFTVGSQLMESLRRQEGMTRKAARREAEELLKRVGIPAPKRGLASYPYELSGGMRQRVMIAIAIALRPSILIADEPTTALDVTIKIQILELLRELQVTSGDMAVLLITHDLSQAAEYADDLAVMYAGQLVEFGPTSEVLQNPAHPYTQGLLRSIPGTASPGTRLQPIDGRAPDLRSDLHRCPFYPRCPQAQSVCLEEETPFVLLSNGRKSRCHFAMEIVR